VIDVREGAALAALEASGEPIERSVEGDDEKMRLVLRARKASVAHAVSRARDRAAVSFKELERPAVELEAEAEAARALEAPPPAQQPTAAS
jgi:hypothetical protein